MKPWRYGLGVAIAVCALISAGCYTAPANDRPGGEQGAVIQLNPGAVQADPEDQHLSRSHNNNHVRWRNDTNSTLTLHFTADNPFLGTAADIAIPPHSFSAWYTIDPAGTTPHFPYHITPPLSSTGPPGDPVISGDP